MYISCRYNVKSVTGMIESKKQDGRGIKQIRDRTEISKKYLSGSLKKTTFEDMDVAIRIKLI